MNLNRQKFSRQAPLAGQCEVCIAARRLQQAQDAMNTFLGMGGKPSRNDPFSVALKGAQAVWDYTRDGRHTGGTHTPVVVG